MAKTVAQHCKICKKHMNVRVSDLKRGWGKFCSKSCAAGSKSQHFMKAYRKRYQSLIKFLRRLL